MPIPLVDLQKQYASIKADIDAAVLGNIASGQFVLGPYVQKLETEIAAFCEVAQAIGVASGTDALLLALRALDIGAGDEVIVPAFTFFATAGAVHNCGARPVFCDIEPETYNLNPAEIERHISQRTKAIIPVHLFGQCAAMDEILAIAQGHGLAVIEDAAQAIGATYRGRKAGSIGDIGCFSFFPTKNLGGYGDGGMIVTKDANIADKVRLLRVHGGGTQYYHQLVGYNSRLDALQAAILSAKLPYLAEWSEQRRRNAANYNVLFEQVTDLIRPIEREEHYCIYNQYTLRMHNRDRVMAALKARSIGCAIYYPLPLHLQDCFRYLGYSQGAFPVSEQMAREVLSIPIFAEITREQQQEIADTIIQALSC
ncbi:DegT/DnrJ/EryC1/StrS family aminotransferase [bacterium]|nr:DegT/DnrJ/EryC1/StrS family aminotransferase [bacterium]